MKEKGFTLVELIAVVVLLAVIALIATPQIIKIINDSNKKSFRSSAEGLMESVEQAHMDIQYDRQIKEVMEFNLTTGENMELLKTSGSGPTDGYVRISPKGLIELAVRNERYCAVKNYSEGKVKVYSINNSVCTTEMSGNLLVNGYGELGNNTNFSSFTYQEDTVPYFTYTSNSAATLLTDDMVPVNPTKKYRIQLDMQSSNLNATYSIGIAEYDTDKHLIPASHTMYMENTSTTLASDLNDGDMTVDFMDLTNWDVNTGTRAYQRGFIFWNYKDSKNTNYPAFTYSRHVWYDLYTDANVDKSTNTITLTSPWDHGTIPAGTEVSQSDSGEVYNYGLANQSSLTSDWKTYTTTITGQAYPTTNAFRFGTKYIRLIILNNSNNIADTTTYIRNISIKEVE